MLKNNKYLMTYKLTWTQATDYRFNFIFEFICCFIPVIALLFLWKAIYINQNNIGDYNIYMMFTYIIFARFVSMIITPSFFFDVTDEIQQGTLSNYIVKPINYIKYWFYKELGSKSKSFIFGIIPILLVCLIYNKYVILNISLLNCFLFILSFLLAYVIYFEIIMLSSLLSFWFYEISSWFYTISFIVEFLSGSLVPIDLLPEFLQKVLQFLPFKYLVFFPVKILTNSLTNSELLYGLVIQLIWLLIIFGAMKIIWKYGRKKYDAFGG